jgi:hypothetical protein
VEDSLMSTMHTIEGSCGEHRAPHIAQLL